jgi:hypothetical protein
VACDRDEEVDRCMQSALGEGDRDGNDSCSNLAHRDTKREVVGGAPQMLTNGADFPLGPSLPTSRSSSREQDGELNGLIDALGTRTPSAAHQTIESAAESEIGPTATGMGF